MKDFFKYLTVSTDDKNWGLYLNVAGTARIAPNTIYPSPTHPSGYFYTWEKGRVLNEFQINYITEGSGVFENEFGKFNVRPGTLMLICPGVWHRYRPIEKVGWRENYIGFDGDIAIQLMHKIFDQYGQSVIHCDVREEFIDTYYKIYNLVQKEKPGFQQISSGLIIKLLGYIVSYQKQINFKGKPVEKIIQNARFYMRDNISLDIDFQVWAEENNIGYAYFRKMFKKYTGISPLHYHIELKMMRAKELLLTTDKSVKEVAYELGFQSMHYFSRLFRKKTGKVPSSFRN